ncbi:MAG: YihY/virulence factor BrkB family protein [Chromatiaceae bacterium]|nr:YihY/virulence factor BrkB family protein [Chromatiaceae bacterium]
MPSARAAAVSKDCVESILRHPGRFVLRVLAAFRRNQGLLLSGAVAYYMLLSIIPLFVLLLVGLSKILPEDQLMATVQRDLALIIPAAADTVGEHLRSFLEHRHLVGWVGFVVLVFFSTVSFTMLENAMSVIFFHRVAIHRRHFLVSALIPFLFIALIGAGLLLITLISGALETLDDEQIRLFGYEWVLRGLSGTSLYLLGVLGLVLLLTALYLVMPTGRIAVSHALIGGLVAAVLWEISRHLLVWYFKTLSLVNLIYGSLASAVVVLLSFEVAALILLLGAQVIAEFERCVLGDPNGGDSGFHT